MNRKFELWSDYYHKSGIRHLFIEQPYFTGKFLNLWMKTDSDDILNMVYDNLEGTMAHHLMVKEYYKKIKEQCPETIFHGTDVGHQYDTTGQEYLTYLEDNNLGGSEQYKLTKENIEQGKAFYRTQNSGYRENRMVENFIREIDTLGNENVMAVYGGAHTRLNSIDYTGNVPNMATQLQKRYSDNIHSEDLSYLVKDIEPSRIDTIEIGGKEYQTSYFGQKNLKNLKDYKYRNFWRIEEAYEDFRNNKKIKNVLSYYSYPMLIEEGQVFMVDYTKFDGSIVRKFYRSNGRVWKNRPATEQFEVKE